MLAADELAPGDGHEFFYEGEGDCTSERVRGQFSIFGAIEEKLCCGFSRIFTDEYGRSRHAAECMGVRVFELTVGVGRFLSERRGGISTGIAQEMQKPVPGSQRLFSVPASMTDFPGGGAPAFVDNDCSYGSLQ